MAGVQIIGPSFAALFLGQQEQEPAPIWDDAGIVGGCFIFYVTMPTPESFLKKEAEKERVVLSCALGNSLESGYLQPLVDSEHFLKDIMPNLERIGFGNRSADSVILIFLFFSSFFFLFLHLLKLHGYWQTEDGGGELCVNHSLPLGNPGLYIMFLKSDAEFLLRSMFLLFCISL